MKTLIKLCKEYYNIPGNELGGNLHIVLDDGNIEDGSIDFCLKQAEEKNDPKGIQICKLIFELTYDERQKLYESIY